MDRRLWRAWQQPRPWPAHVAHPLCEVGVPRPSHVVVRWVQHVQGAACEHTRGEGEGANASTRYTSEQCLSKYATHMRSEEGAKRSTVERVREEGEASWTRGTAGPMEFSTRGQSRCARARRSASRRRTCRPADLNRPPSCGIASTCRTWTTRARGVGERDLGVVHMMAKQRNAHAHAHRLCDSHSITNVVHRYTPIRIMGSPPNSGTRTSTRWGVRRRASYASA